MRYAHDTTRVATVLLDAGADPRGRLGGSGPTPLELLERTRQREAGSAPPGHPCEAQPSRKNYDGLRALLMGRGAAPPDGA